jgi:hypothetical protein
MQRWVEAMTSQIRAICMQHGSTPNEEVLHTKPLASVMNVGMLNHCASVCCCTVWTVLHVRMRRPIQELWAFLIWVPEREYLETKLNIWTQSYASAFHFLWKVVAVTETYTFIHVCSFSSHRSLQTWCNETLLVSHTPSFNSVSWHSSHLSLQNTPLSLPFIEPSWLFGSQLWPPQWW